ncbi:phosphatidylinositol 4-phosphate 3-kinase C2 domain-containing subunit alpha isoform X1 [Diabrotica virgifera virgifera]|uniref:Phosphatidylinositol 4-phosphate 3-kinase C2 domain-containing subunit alpha isoform X1 n=1 Tax=Diabrotica virgifera virgifera TaxID=50390 RepID=A0A6P7F399_DIAVI|nr:phosphatidylinositol 4-phosphate 3-kinase C2 domain-containing subunit alpha isoform X1 [Diabrotica virgifera virgifera]
MADYEKQFQEDLERAQALSLESLALEQFKTKKLQELNRSATTINVSSRPKLTSVTRASSMNETDSGQIRYDRQQSKSRPRPGVQSSSGNSLLAPPPSSQRKNSISNDPDTPDLISFSSPPATTSTSNDIIDFCKQQNYNQQLVLSSSMIQQQPSHFKFWPQMAMTPPTSAFPSNVPPQGLIYPNGSYYPPINRVQYSLNTANSPIVPPSIPWSSASTPTSINVRTPSSVGPQLSSTPNSGISTPVQQHSPSTNIGSSLHRPSSIPQMQTPPALPPKNQRRPPPPLIVTKSSSISSRLSSLSVTSTSSEKEKKEKSLFSPNLIDFAQSDDKDSVRVSILQEFDPLSESFYSAVSARAISPDYSGSVDDTMSICNSVYEEYDPYDFIYSGSGNNSISDPIYATVNKPDNTPMSPGISRMSTIDRRSFKCVKRNLLNIIEQVNNRALTKDPDLKSFYNMVYNIRKQYKYNDPDTNMGLVISPMVNYDYSDGLSIKLQVHPDFEGADFNQAISFTCDVNSSVEHVTMQLTYGLDAPATTQYTLKVWGSNEYLVPTTFLSDYEYVHDCIKLDEDVILILIPDSKKDKSFARTVADDNDDETLKFENIIPNDSNVRITYEKLNILLETVENEMRKLEEASVQVEKNTTPSVMPGIQPLNVIQSVKYIVNLMGDLCTLDIMNTIEALEETCRNFLPSNKTTFSEFITNHCNKIRFAVQNLIEMYCQAFSVDFEVKSTSSSESMRYVHDIMDSVVVRICAIYRPSFEWEHEEYTVTAQIYHGTKKIGKSLCTQPVRKYDRDKYWPARIVFDHWLEFEDVPINSLARESRLVVQIYGRTLVTSDSEETKNSSAPIYKEEEIGWAAVQFFNYESSMNQGSILLSMWPKESNYINDHIYGPSPAMGSHPDPEHSVIGIEIVAPTKVQFPSMSPELYNNVTKGDFSSLDNETQQLLVDACDQDLLYRFSPEIREILWEKRHYLYHLPTALPKLLLAAHSWEYVQLPDLHGMLHAWTRLKPIQALELLLPVYPDLEVRRMAIRWIRGLTNDELVDYLPQLVVALRHETYENSPLAQFLLDRALRSPRFAHYLFWLLCHSLPGDSPQNCSTEVKTKDIALGISEFRHHRRLKLLLRALLAICGRSLGDCFLYQQSLVKKLNDIAEEVQKTKDSHRVTVLHNALGQIHKDLQETPTSLPLSPTLRVKGVDIQSCSYFPSATLPLKINFLMEDSSLRAAIYKVGDDLQQDMLTLQMIRLMDKLWLSKGLDLKMVAFTCIPTSRRKGMIEMVTKAETLRKIQVEHGLTGSFKDKPIAEWLAKHNPSELEYARAIQNFTASCAGYCVITYILGICDRHNDNIMLKTSGHLFHIDFGKFLGDAQMFGNFKRDRAPFVLTSDMAYVINGGDRPTEKFHQFVDLCCQAFNIIRNNRNLFLFLITSSGICRITPESIAYMHKALLPESSNPEAAAYFTRLIEESLKTRFTQFNFFLHNLAQLKFTAENNEGSLLSFVPKTYSLATDGQLVHVEVVNYRKRYDPDKYYVYILRVYRKDQRQPMEIQRTYKEFCELHQKLCIYFPLAKLHSLSTGLHMGRSNIKQVAQKRFHEISLFVKSLFLCAHEIAHSDLVYTFFHPLLRDQQYSEEYSKKVKDRTTGDFHESGRLKGQLKLSLQYRKGVFCVMVQHARGLPRLANSQEPSTYVKVYLQPDAQKSTKRKTKVVKKNCHPSFMEMLEYRMSLEIIKMRRLQATVWNYDALQENEFMGGVELDLSSLDLTEEISEWYSLVNLSR